jgi:hypothetical protein
VQNFLPHLAILQAADASTTAPSSLPLIHDAVTELARLHWPFFPGVSVLNMIILRLAPQPSAFGLN